MVSIVLGAGFGDEGKGKITNFLSKKNKDSIVVRFNGGHQAGHTVVENGVRHVFSSFGSGSLNGTTTFISKYCTIFPPAMLLEYSNLLEKGINPTLYVDPLAMVTTPYDISINRYDEISRTNAHGSCGSGFGKTVERHETLDHSHRIFAKDLGNRWVLRLKLEMMEAIVPIQHRTVDIDSYISKCMECYDLIKLMTEQDVFKAGSFGSVVFEGAQGILLDREHGIFPHVTRSRTTSANVFEMLNRNKVDKGGVKIYYLSRAYQTRHGNGPLLGEGYEIHLSNNDNETNVTNEWQGVFRKAPLSIGLLKYAVESDMSYHTTNVRRELMISHLDQLEKIPLLKLNSGVHLADRDELSDIASTVLEMKVTTLDSETL